MPRLADVFFFSGTASVGVRLAALAFAVALVVVAAPAFAAAVAAGRLVDGVAALAGVAAFALPAAVLLAVVDVADFVALAGAVFTVLVLAADLAGFSAAEVFVAAAFLVADVPVVLFAVAPLAAAARVGPALVAAVERVEAGEPLAADFAAATVRLARVGAEPVVRSLRDRPLATAADPAGVAPSAVAAPFDVRDVADFAPAATVLDRVLPCCAATAFVAADRAALARSAMASPKCKTGARRCAAHSLRVARIRNVRASDKHATRCGRN